MTRPHDLSNSEILLTLGDLLEALKQPHPDEDVNRILNTLPCDCATLTRLLGALAVRAASMTLDIAGVVTGSGPVMVEVVANRPADDIPNHAKVAADLARRGCDFLVAMDDVDAAPSRALNEAAHAAAHRGPEFAFLVLSELLGRIRRLLHGDTREVITS